MYYESHSICKLFVVVW